MIFTELLIDIAASSILVLFGFLFGKFKCTIMPIYRDGYGLVGAICINVDYNYFDKEVRKDQKKLDFFLDSILKTDMVLDENILIKNEYEKAIDGKRYFKDA